MSELSTRIRALVELLPAIKSCGIYSLRNYQDARKLASLSAELVEQIEYMNENCTYYEQYLDSGITIPSYHTVCDETLTRAEALVKSLEGGTDE